MKRSVRGLLAMLSLIVSLELGAAVFAGEAPQYEARKVTDNVYIFRYGGAQAMFVVTPDGG